jgi:hypothetical protein
LGYDDRTIFAKTHRLEINIPAMAEDMGWLEPKDHRQLIKTHMPFGFIPVWRERLDISHLMPRSLNQPILRLD